MHVDEWLRRHRGEQIHEGVVRRHDRRVILELAHERVANAAAKMHIQRRRDEHVHDDKFGREQHRQQRRQTSLLANPPPRADRASVATGTERGRQRPTYYYTAGVGATIRARFHLPLHSSPPASASLLDHGSFVRFWAARLAAVFAY